jgi:hypothetical protein
MAPPKSIRDKDVLRDRFLSAVYDATGGSSVTMTEVTLIAEELALDLDEAHEIVGFLAGAGLLKRESYNLIRITHLGVRSVESQQRASERGEMERDSPAIPPEISHSLMRFREDYPDHTRTAFLMMRFGQTRAHRDITTAIRDVLSAHGICGLRADDKTYHDELFSNVRTYLHGCTFGIAVFERVDRDDFNPNVSLEVGYLFGLGRDVCLLKDRTLQTLHTDLTGRLYAEFDPQEPADTIPNPLTKWLADKRYLATP